MLARLSAFAVWAFVGATAVFWGLRLWVSAPVAPAYAVAVGDLAAVRGDLSRLLGATPVSPGTVAIAPESSSRFRLLGVVASKVAGANGVGSTNGVALIAVDGKMPKAFSVGARLDGDLMLQSVSLRTALIGGGQGVPPITLELPRVAPAATGTLLSGSMGGTPALPSAPALVPQYMPAYPSPSAVLQPMPTSRNVDSGAPTQ